MLLQKAEQAIKRLLWWFATLGGALLVHMFGCEDYHDDARPISYCIAKERPEVSARIGVDVQHSPEQQDPSCRQT